MSSGWRKVENENGFPFYVSESDNSRQWDHPKFSNVKQRLDDCNYIKYASYRVASKFRVLQHALSMNEVPLGIIAGVFEKHRLGATESSLPLESCDLEAMLSDIFFAANKQCHAGIDVDFATELTLTFLYNMFDKDRKVNIEVQSAKVALALLSNCKSTELYKFLFTLCSDHNSCVTRLRLQSVLSKVCAVTTYLKENVSFGQHLVNVSIEQCFNNNPGLVGISESTFLLWLEKTPQLFTWLPVLHRLRISETVLHHGKCSVCKLTPLMGLRYSCLKCRSYVQCQRCFLTGRISRSHKLSHTMREYCRENVNGWKFCDLPTKLFRFLRCMYSVSEGCIMDVNVIDAKLLSGNNKDVLLKPLVNEEHCHIEPLSSPHSQLQVIIRQLELQNRELQQMLLSGLRNDKQMKQCLEEHRIHVEAQIEKLKVLKDHMNASTTSPIPKPKLNILESTPMVHNGNTAAKRIMKPLDMFSPIASLPDLTEKEKAPPPPFNLDSSRKDKNDTLDLTTPYSIRDISTWIGGQPQSSNEKNTTSTDNHILSHGNAPPVETDLDDALAKLQQILANNFSLDESLGNMDNSNLKNAVNEVEGMLSSIIDNVETNKNVITVTTAC